MYEIFIQSSCVLWTLWAHSGRQSCSLATAAAITVNYQHKFSSLHAYEFNALDGAAGHNYKFCTRRQRKNPLYGIVLWLREERENII